MGGSVNAQERWRTRSRPCYRETVDRWSVRPLAELTSDELRGGVVELLDAGTEYYTSVQTIIPIAVTSEALLTRCYSAAVARRGDPPPSAFLLGFDNVPILAEKSLYDLSRWVTGRPELAVEVLTTSVPELVQRLAVTDADGSRDGSDEHGSDEDWSELRSRFRAHLDRYGHLVYNLDFVNAVPADDLRR
jgi:pyruvate,water dikinase